MECISSPVKEPRHHVLLKVVHVEGLLLGAVASAAILDDDIVRVLGAGWLHERRGRQILVAGVLDQERRELLLEIAGRQVLVRL